MNPVLTSAMYSIYMHGALFLYLPLLTRVFDGVGGEGVALGQVVAHQRRGHVVEGGPVFVAFLVGGQAVGPEIVGQAAAVVQQGQTNQHQLALASHFLFVCMQRPFAPFTSY